MRQDGYYWVNKTGSWLIGYWGLGDIGYCFTLCGWSEELLEDYFDEINEQTIKSPDETN